MTRATSKIERDESNKNNTSKGIAGSYHELMDFMFMKFTNSIKMKHNMWSLAMNKQSLEVPTNFIKSRDLISYCFTDIFTVLKHIVR